MRNFKAQLQQVSSTMAELQNRMGQMEVGEAQNQEAIRAMDSRMEGAGMGQRLDGSVARLREDIQQFMVMFTRQNQVRVAENFPPIDRNEPLLHRNEGDRGRANVEMEADPKETLEGVVGNDRNGAPNGQHSRFTMPRWKFLYSRGLTPVLDKEM